MPVRLRLPALPERDSSSILPDPGSIHRGACVDWIWTILLGIIEGITEFLPISSTAHLLLAERWMGLDLDAPFWKVFAIFIQIGAILAVVVYFWGRIVDIMRGRVSDEEPEDRDTPRGFPVSRSGDGDDEAGDAPAVAVRDATWGEFMRHPVWMVVVASAPTFLIGLAVYGWVERYMADPLVISAALAVGGVVMILIELWRPEVRTVRMEQIRWRQALVIGLAQLLSAVVPGTSRAAATIMGGMLVGLSRRAATEFSFFLAIPVMFAAGGYSLLRNWMDMTMREVGLVAVGTAVSFVVAWVVIAGLMQYIRRYTFIPFGVYRILLAAAVLVWLYT
jgi:undecaprenyl-diphosphatase